MCSERNMSLDYMLHHWERLKATLSPLKIHSGADWRGKGPVSMEMSYLWFLPTHFQWIALLASFEKVVIKTASSQQRSGMGSLCDSFLNPVVRERSGRKAHVFHADSLQCSPNVVSIPGKDSYAKPGKDFAQSVAKAQCHLFGFTWCNVWIPLLCLVNHNLWLSMLYRQWWLT